MSPRAGVAAMLLLSLVVHAAVAVALAELVVRSRSSESVLPRLFVDLIEPVVVSSPAAPPSRPPGGSAAGSTARLAERARGDGSSRPLAGRGTPSPEPESPVRGSSPGAPAPSPDPPSAVPAPLTPPPVTPPALRTAPAQAVLLMPHSPESLATPLEVEDADPARSSSSAVRSAPRGARAGEPARRDGMPGTAASGPSPPTGDAAPGTRHAALRAATGAGSSAGVSGGTRTGGSREASGPAPSTGGREGVEDRGMPEVPASGARRGEVARVPGEEGAAVPPEYAGYVRTLRRRIQERLVYPWLAVRQGLRGTIELEIQLGPDGRVTGLAVVGGEVAPSLREAALRAVRDATPFPLPRELPPRPLTVRLPVVFELRP